MPHFIEAKYHVSVGGRRKAHLAAVRDIFLGDARFQAELSV